MCVPHGDVGVVSDHLFRQHLHMNVGVVELLPHLPQLTHGVVQIAFALTPASTWGKKFMCQSIQSSSPPPPAPPCRPVVEGHSRGRLLLAEEGRWLHLRVTEAKVLVEIIKAVDKVTHMTSKHLNVQHGSFMFF